MSLYPSLHHGHSRTCRLFFCYQCQRTVRIISSPSFPVSFCPRCFGSFLHEIHLPPFSHPFPSHALFLPYPPGAPHSQPVVRAIPGPPPPPASIPTAVHPGDYFAGPNMNELIEELTQNDRPGLPPAPASAIGAIPTVRIGGAHLQDGSQCPVCKEDFEMGEEAREMPCKHVFHSDCIVPWLRIHNSCPVCRFQLPTSDDTTRNSQRVSRRSTRGSGGGGGSARQDSTRRNTIPSLWPFWGSGAPRWEHEYQRRVDDGDPLDNPGGNNPIVSQMFNMVFFSVLFFYILA